MKVLFTRFASLSGPLAKVLGVGPEGKLQKGASAQMVRGTFETLSLDMSTSGTGGRLAAMLSGWAPTQALSPSLCITGLDAGE